ncbi:hypothetical protein [Halarcobacter mediterraneus]|nr:hypothetical protein [Halarcobacter mediterraneus]
MKIDFTSYVFIVARDRKCPNCGSTDDIIDWDGGYMCRDCGTEW